MSIIFVSLACNGTIHGVVTAPDTKKIKLNIVSRLICLEGKDVRNQRKVNLTFTLAVGDDAFGSGCCCM